MTVQWAVKSYAPAQPSVSFLQPVTPGSHCNACLCILPRMIDVRNYEYLFSVFPVLYPKEGILYTIF